MGRWAGALQVLSLHSRSGVWENIRTSLSEDLDTWALLVNDSPNVPGISSKKKNL